MLFTAPSVYLTGLGCQLRYGLDDNFILHIFTISFFKGSWLHFSYFHAPYTKNFSICFDLE